MWVKDRFVKEFYFSKTIVIDHIKFGFGSSFINKGKKTALKLLNLELIYSKQKFHHVPIYFICG